MAHIPVDQLDNSTRAELACTYAALILNDDGLDVTGDKISKLLAAADIKVEGYWPTLFAKALVGRRITDLIAGGGGSAATGGSATVQAAAPVEKKEEPKKEEVKKKEEPKVEEDFAVGGLFGDDF